MSKPIVLSGVHQPSGELSIGNYLGALRQWQLECKMTTIANTGRVDLHAITVRQDRKRCMKRLLNALAICLAVGVDQEEHAI
ncbi:hypothetical protein OK016_07465 [Vibrio chagasii]|nr:hypothetical protein [Vibrio chagasii]